MFETAAEIHSTKAFVNILFVHAKPFKANFHIHPYFEKIEIVQFQSLAENIQRIILDSERYDKLGTFFQTRDR